MLRGLRGRNLRTESVGLWRIVYIDSLMDIFSISFYLKVSSTLVNKRSNVNYSKALRGTFFGE